MDVRIKYDYLPSPPNHVITYIADFYNKQHEIITRIK